MKKRKVIFVVMDGLGDRPIKELGDKTPLEAANTPNLDRLASEGAIGLMYTVAKGIAPGSDTAHLSLFGYDLEKYYPGRGPFEAAGVGMEMKEGDVAWRCNLATVDERGVVADRRAGRIESTEPFIRELDGKVIGGVLFSVKPGTAYRFVLRMRGKGLSDKVEKNDPKVAGKRILRFVPENESRGAKFTAELMNKFVDWATWRFAANPVNKERSAKGLPVANAILCRGVGYMKKIPGFKKMYGMKACCIAGAGLYKGIGRILGMDVIEVEGANGLPDTDVEAKVNAAVDAMEKYNFAFVHIKAADSLGEDGNAKGKKEFIERADKAFGKLIGLKDVCIVVTADHSTPCEDKAHSADPVPVLVRCAGLEASGAAKFCERECAKGSLGRLETGKKLMGIITKCC